MKCKAEMIEDILERIGRTTDKPLQARVERLLTSFYFKLCRKHPYMGLCNRIELDFASTGEDGVLLPANMFGIKMVTDVTYGFEYHPLPNPFNLHSEQGGYRYYMRAMRRVPVYVGTDGTLSNAATTFLSTALTTDYTGDYVQFGREPGFYLLSAIKTFSPTYYGPSYSGGSLTFAIRPVSAKNLFLIDRANDIYDDTSVYVDYWQAPQPLYLDGDMTVLPSTTPLELLVLRELPEAKARAPVSKGEIDEAIAECEGMDGAESRMDMPRGEQGSRFTFSDDDEPFGDRE